MALSLRVSLDADDRARCIRKEGDYPSESLLTGADAVTQCAFPFYFFPLDAHFHVLAFGAAGRAIYEYHYRK